MKAIILAADSGTVIKEKLTPKCLLRIGEKTVLERQISSLVVLGIKEIYVVIGEGGDVWNKSVIDQVKTICPYTIIYNDRYKETLSSYSLYLSLLQIEVDDVLIMDGDLVFESNTLDVIVNSHNGNVILAINDRMSNGYKVELTERPKDGYLLEGIGKDIISNYIYAGIMKIEKASFSHLWELVKAEEHNSYPLAHVIEALICKANIWCIKLLEAKDGEVLYELASMAGGSYSSTRKIIMPDHSKIIRKEVVVKGEEKLVDEIQWIQNLEEPLRKHFPEILNYKLNMEPTFYEMPCYELPTLRTLLLKNNINIKEVLRYLSKIFDLLFNRVYVQDRKPASHDFIREIHLKKIWQRLIETKHNNVFNKILKLDKLIINGREFMNIQTVIDKINQNLEFMKIVTPTHTCRTQGDLHFDNILVDIENDNFILVDPRGNYEYDICYDLGKVWHSCHGLYDLIHTRRFEFVIENDNINYEFTDKSAVERYSVVLDKLPDILSHYDLLREEGDWITKTIFAEAALFCSVIPFHLRMDGREEVALMLYARGVELINDIYQTVLCQMKNKAIVGGEFVNISSEEDYLRAGKLFR